MPSLKLKSIRMTKLFKLSVLSLAILLISNSAIKAQVSDTILSGGLNALRVAVPFLTIAPDSFLLTTAYKNFEVFRNIKQQILDGGKVNTNSLVASNPELYNAYLLAGDYLYRQKAYAAALQHYKQALTKVIATKKEEDHIREQIRKINKKLAP